MKRPGVLAALCCSLAAGTLLLVLLTATARVPEGCVGLTGREAAAARVLATGLHLVRPFATVDLYPLEAVTVAGRAAALSREGARIEIEYALSAAPDPQRLHLLPPRSVRGADGEIFARDLAAVIERGLASARGGTIDGPESRIRALMEGAGMTVADLRAAAGPAGVSGLERPIVLIGLDGADWQIIDPLIARGRLPNLAALERRSVRGALRSFEPILSPLLWTTAATGKPPDEHGIIDFLVPDPATGRRVPISSRARRVKALWNIFSERGLSSDVVAWWASWPAETIRGNLVSDRVAYSLFAVDEAREGLTHPPSLMQRIRPDMVADDEIGYDDIARFLDVERAAYEDARARARQDPAAATKDPVTHLARILASTRTYHRIALRLLSDRQPDLFAVYYQAIDEVSHRFAHFMPPRMALASEPDFARYRRAVEEMYVYQDELLGEILARISPRSTIVVMSDHGFHNGPSRPTDGPADIEGKPGKWHRLYGVLLIAGEGIGPGRFDTATLFDITPTILALAGLPQADDMTGTPLLRRAGGGAAAKGPARVASYEGPGGALPATTQAPAAAGEADEELLRNLASLGYISAAEIAPSTASVAAPGAGSVTGHTNLAALLLQKGDLDGAESELRRALEMRPGYFPSLMTLGQVLVRRGRVEEALDVTRRAVAGSDQAEQGAYVQLALLAASAGQSAQAANFLEALRARRPGADGIETALGVLALDAGSRERAEARFRAALAIDPTSVDAMSRLFSMYRSQTRETALEPQIREALAINDRSVMHRNWLGLILMRRGDMDGAEKEFRRAMDLAPDFGGTMANLGSLYGRTGRLEEAVTVLSRALRIDPQNLEARVNLGASLAKLGRLGEAIASLEEARGRGVRSVELLNAVGLAYAEAGRTREAVEALEESLTLSPDQPRVRQLLSDLSRPT